MIGFLIFAKHSEISWWKINLNKTVWISLFAWDTDEVSLFVKTKTKNPFWLTQRMIKVHTQISKISIAVGSGYYMPTKSISMLS